MSIDLEQRLRNHYSNIADELELRPGDFDEVLDRSIRSDVADLQPAVPHPRHRSERWLAAAAVLIAVVVGLGVIARQTVNDNDIVDDVDRPLTLLSTVETIDDDDWVIATRLPDGVVYMYASGRGGAFGSDRTVRYGNERLAGMFERMSVAVTAEESVDGETLIIDGNQWTVDDPLTGGWTAVRRLGAASVVVRDSGPFDAEDREVLAGLATINADQMPSPPLGDESEAVVVARGGPGSELRVQESGGYWWATIGGSGGCCSSIETDAEGITVDSGFFTVADGASTGRVVVGGSVVTPAELVQVEFIDGTIVDATPTDLSGRFDRKFWVVDTTLPTNQRTAVEVRAYDATGGLLAAVTPTP